MQRSEGALDTHAARPLVLVVFVVDENALGVGVVDFRLDDQAGNDGVGGVDTSNPVADVVARGRPEIREKWLIGS